MPAWSGTPGPATQVTEGQPLFTLLTDEPERFDRALASLEGGFDIGDGASFSARDRSCSTGSADPWSVRLTRPQL